MPFNYGDNDLRVQVALGRENPNKLPSAERARAARDRERAEWEKAGHKETVYRDVPGEGKIAVPQFVLDAEARDSITRVFQRTIDRQGYPWSGWTLPIPRKPAAVIESERYFKVPFRWDPITGEYYKPSQHQMPPHMAAVNDKLAEDDPRRARYDWARETWVFPVEHDIEQTPQPRDDLVSEHGHPLTGGPHSHHMGGEEPEGGASA